MSLRNSVKWGSLAGLIALSVWLLLPPSTETPSPGSLESPLAAQPRAQEIKYHLIFSPASIYTPGLPPMGIGKPLEGLDLVLREFQRRFPDTRVEIVTRPGNREYLVTQLSSGRAPDILNSNVEDIWIDVEKNWYIPLDQFLERPNPFVAPGQPGAAQWWDMFKYQAISRGKAAPDGRNYCISYDMIETGLFYNKDIFREVGVEVPADWEEFMDVLAQIQAYRRPDGKQYIPILMDGAGSFSDWCVDLFFDQLYHSLLPGIDLHQDPQREPYLQGYLDWNELCFLFHQGFFTADDPRYRNMWELMKKFRRYTTKNLSGTDLIREFVTERGAVYWTASSFCYRLTFDNAVDFDWGVFYPPRFTTRTTPWASNVDMCVIGGAASQFAVTNRAVSDTDPSLPFEQRIATSERLRRAISLLQFMTIPGQYEKVVNEFPCYIPNIRGVESLPVLQPFVDILERRYTTTKWVFSFDLRFQEIQNRMLELYLQDGLSLDEFLGWMRGSLAAACTNAEGRKTYDAEGLEREWQRLAPARANMSGLPHAP